MATTIMTDFLAMVVIVLFIAFVYSRFVHKGLRDVADDILNLIQGGKKDE
jgi:hypothetical protein